MKIAHYIITFVLAVIVSAFAAQKGYGFVLAFLLPAFLVHLIYSAVRMARRPDERRSRGIRLVVWSVALSLALSFQAFWSVGSRSDAESALKKILAHKERAGSYPASLREMGLDDDELQGKWRLRYSVKEGKPRLTYPAPIMPLTMYEYDFEARVWRKNAY